MLKIKFKQNTFLYALVGLVIVVAISFFATPSNGETLHHQHKGEIQEIKHYTCGMHPSVKVSPEEYNKGTKNCPICNMNLTPVHNAAKGAGSDIRGGKHE